VKKAKNVKALKIVDDNILKYRKLKGLTIVELAFQCGVDSTQISNMELAKYDSTRSSIYLVAEKLGIHPGLLFNQD